MATINTTLSDIYKSTPMGDVTTAIGSALYGINHRMTPGAIPINRDTHGLVFFTRPQLNLTDGNVSALRQLVPLLTTQDLSIQRMVRKLLDPRLSSLSCPIVDDKQVFIPILTNHCLTLSGWPDPVLDYHTTKPGVYKEEVSFIDSTLDNYASFNLSATFRNMVADPILLLISSWRKYMSAVYKGEMVPYPDMIAFNEVDYNTRIYRLVLDKNKRLVQKIAACGASFPYTDTEGQGFNYEFDKPVNSGNEQLQVNFRCMGYCYNDHILIREFNNAVGIFNPEMRDDQLSAMKQVPYELLQQFNNLGYPRIDPDTLELQWYVTTDQYNATMAAYSRHRTALGQSTDYTQYDSD